MIIFAVVATLLMAYNQGIDKPYSHPTTKEIYEAKKKDRQ